MLFLIVDQSGRDNIRILRISRPPLATPFYFRPKQDPSSVWAQDSNIVSNVRCVVVGRSFGEETLFKDGPPDLRYKKVLVLSLK